MNPSSVNFFSGEIQSFRNLGTYSSSYNSLGTLKSNLSSSIFSENFLSITVEIEDFSDQKILALYSPEFEEFVEPKNSSIPSTTDIQSKLDEEIKKYESKLEDSQNKLSELTSESMATKSVIISLRIQLGQGSVESDFSNSFPYAPKKVV